MTVDIRVAGADRLYELNRQLRGADRKLARQLRRGIRNGAKPAVTATKKAVLKIPVIGSRGGGRSQREQYAFKRSKVADEEKRRARAQRRAGLRQTIAAAIKLQIRTGKATAAVRIEVDESKLPPDQRTLPKHLDSETGWRHPVFGNRDVWASQKGKPWFEVTIRDHLDEVRAAVLKAMDEVANQIERGA